MYSTCLQNRMFATGNFEIWLDVSANYKVMNHRKCQRFDNCTQSIDRLIELLQIRVLHRERCRLQQVAAVRRHVEPQLQPVLRCRLFYTTRYIHLTYHSLTNGTWYPWTSQHPRYRQRDRRRGGDGGDMSTITLMALSLSALDTASIGYST